MLRRSLAVSSPGAALACVAPFCFLGLALALFWRRESARWARSMGAHLTFRGGQVEGLRARTPVRMPTVAWRASHRLTSRRDALARAMPSRSLAPPRQLHPSDNG